MAVASRPAPLEPSSQPGSSQHGQLPPQEEPPRLSEDNKPKAPPRVDDGGGGGLDTVVPRVDHVSKPEPAITTVSWVAVCGAGGWLMIWIELCFYTKDLTKYSHAWDSFVNREHKKREIRSWTVIYKRGIDIDQQFEMGKLSHTAVPINKVAQLCSYGASAAAMWPCDVPCSLRSPDDVQGHYFRQRHLPVGRPGPGFTKATRKGGPL